MRCFLWTVIAVLLLLLAESTATAVRIPIYGKQFVKLYVGNPGKTITFRLRHDLNQSYIYDAQPQQYSDTFTADSDVVYFNHRYIRLNFIYGIAEPDQRFGTATNIPYSGVLALGPGSDIWQYWSSFTRSKFVLTLGGGLDCLDCDAGAKPLQFTLDTECGLSAQTESDSIYPLELRISDDYTYLPAAVFTTLDSKPRQQLSILRLDNTAPQCPIADNTLQPSENRQLVLSVDSEANFIYTPYNSKENLLRISETNIEQPVDGVALGVVMLMEDAVVHVDYVTRRVSVVKAFYSYPRTPVHVATFIPFIAVLLTLWWFVETHPMFVQWTKELFFRFAVILPVSKLRPPKSFSQQPDNSNNTIRQRRKQTELLKKIAADVTAAVPEQQSLSPAKLRAHTWSAQFKRQYLQTFSSMDWETITQMLWLTRLLVLATIFIAVFGLESHRFVYRTMSWISIDPVFGVVLFYALIVQLFVFAALVTDEFVLRYPAASNAVVQYTLFMCVWVAQLHERDTNLLDQFISLIVCTAAITRLMEWVFWNAIRGPDWVYEKSVSLHDLEHGLGTRQTELTGGRAILMYFWIFVFLPFGITILVVGNILPLVEFLWPNSPVRLAVAWCYVLVGVIFMALVNVSNLFLSVYRSFKDRYAQEWEAYKKTILQ